ncbi:MAG: hypothetical protein FRX49_11000 [Trebouxia sp. A1-2]|nr:MAG: hypothetical protein FRX49_11000 [Trebouxia sp. A1-2]
MLMAETIKGCPDTSAHDTGVSISGAKGSPLWGLGGVGVVPGLGQKYAEWASGGIGLGQGPSQGLQGNALYALHGPFS